MKTLLTLLLTSAALYSADFTVTISATVQAEEGWQWWYKASTNNWVRYTTNTVDGTNVVTDLGAPPTFVNFCRSNVISAFNGHGEQFYRSKLSAQEVRATQVSIKTTLTALEAPELAEVKRIIDLWKANPVGVSNALIGL